MYLLYSEPDNHVNKYFKTFTAFFSSFNFLLDNLDEKASWMTKKPHHMSFVVFMSATKRSECTIQHLNRDRKKGKYEQNKDFEVCKARSDPARYIIGPHPSEPVTSPTCYAILRFHVPHIPWNWAELQNVLQFPFCWNSLPVKEARNL